MFWREDRTVVEGASSTLVRTPDGLTFTVLTSGFEPNSALTLWLVVFNNPELCSPPGCSGDDAPGRGGDPGVEASQLWANTGTVVTADGKAKFGGQVKTGDTSGVRVGPGLLNPQGAEVHMIIKSHGPILPEMLGEQLTTYDAGCPPNDCAELQVMVHRPFTDPASVLLTKIAVRLDTIMKRLGIFF